MRKKIPQFRVVLKKSMHPARMDSAFPHRYRMAQTQQERTQIMRDAKYPSRLKSADE